MAHYFENTAITGGVPEVMSYLNDQFVTEGWTSYHINTTASVPTGSSTSTYCFAWKSNGRTGSIGDLPAHHWLMMRWAFESQNDSHIIHGCAAGAKVVGPGSISKTSDTVTVSSSTPHNLRVGDALFVHGAGNSDYHYGWESNDDPLVVTATPTANTFTYTDTSGPVTIGSVGYSYILALYNSKGSFSHMESTINFGIGPFDNNYTPITKDPANFNVYGYVDEYRMACVLEVGGFYAFYYGGLTGRGHVPNSWKHTGALTASVTGTGGPMLLGLDRSCPSMSVGQPIWFVPPNEATGSKNSHSGDPGREGPGITLPTASAKPFHNVVEVTIASGATFPAGTIIGYDPTPCVIVGYYTQTNDITSYYVAAVHSMQGTNPTNSPTYGWDQINICHIYAPLTNDANLNSYVDPAVLGTGSNGTQIRLYYGSDIYLRTGGTATTNHAYRFPLVGVCAWAKSEQSDGDLMVVGENIAANRWKIFTTLYPAGSTNSGLGIGPGAS